LAVQRRCGQDSVPAERAVPAGLRAEQRLHQRQRCQLLLQSASGNAASAASDRTTSVFNSILIERIIDNFVRALQADDGLKKAKKS